jgi:uncharacterized membrane protein YbhN (UPF0104 family)
MASRVTTLPPPADAPSVAAPPALPPTKSNRQAWVLRVGGLIVFLALLLLLEWRGAIKLEDVVRVLVGAAPGPVLLSLAIYIPFVGIKSERWRGLSGAMGLPLRPAEAWRLYCVGLGMGALTPGQAGDLVKAWALARKGYSLGTAIWSSVLDRLFDVVALAPLAALGVWIFGRAFVGDTTLLVVGLIGVVGAIALVARRDLLVRVLPGRLKRLAAGQVGVGTGALGIAAVWTAASFAVSIFRVWLLAEALGLTFGPAELTGIIGLTTVAALVPVSVAGAGPRDAVMVALLARLGYGAEQALALSALILLLNLANAAFGYAVWWWESRSAGAGDQGSGVGGP